MQETQETWVQSLGQEDPLEGKWQPTPVFLPGKSHGQRSLGSYSLMDRKELDTMKHTCNTAWHTAGPHSLNEWMDGYTSESMNYALTKDKMFFEIDVRLLNSRFQHHCHYNFLYLSLRGLQLSIIYKHTHMRS